MKGLIKYLIVLFLPMVTYGQVYLGGLSSNPEIATYLKSRDAEPDHKSVLSTIEPLRLPFADDFSYDDIYPDASRWLDSNVYINAHYPVFPVDYGVATFDVTDKTGKIYSYADIFPFVADYLTSYPIRLDSVFDEVSGTAWKTTAADSIYLSFYYQSQGRGDAPLHYDSLALEFGTTKYHYDTSYLQLHVSEATDFTGEFFGEGDTIKPNDTLFYSGCHFNFAVAEDTLYYEDSLYVLCDTVLKGITTWENVWNAKGETLDTFLINNNAYFKMVMIPITDTAWYKSNFQFRFYNYGSLATILSWKTNTDHWHIDKVYLNAGRTKNDIYTREIRFVQPAGTLLKSFTSMPVYHYPMELRESVTSYINNNDSLNHPVTYSYYVLDNNGNPVPGLTEGFSGILPPYSSVDYNDYAPFAEAPVVAVYEPPNVDETIYNVVHTAKDSDDPSVGDTIYYQQVFSNYFAYDDGTAERSYGASSDNTRIAVQYTSFEPDTLRAVQVYFNQVQGITNPDYFKIGVWNDNNGKPGKLIYETDGLKYTQDEINEFTSFIFPDTIIIRFGIENYFISIAQTTYNNLNIGFDRNTNTRSKTYYSTGGSWISSPFDGTLMIRPVFGKALAEPTPIVKSQPKNLKIYPNPPGPEGTITLMLPSTVSDPKYWKYLTTRIYDLSGRLIFSAPFAEQLNIQGIDPGFYVIDILDKAYSTHHTTKLLIAK